MKNHIESLARKSLSFISPYVPGKPAEVLFRERKLEKIIKLASNENPCGTSPLAIKAIKKCLGSLNRYPEGSAYLLREKLASILKLQVDQIIIGSGSSEIISMAMQAFCEEHDQVIFPSPSFIIYKILAHAFSVEPVIVQLNDDMTYNLEKICEKITKKTKMIILCNPNNPTGSYIKKGQVSEFMKSVPDNILILCDEAYVEYAQDSEFGTALPWIERKNVIVTRTFSKIYGLAGLRIGYGISSKDVISIMEKIRPPFNTTSVAQQAALAALDDHQFVAKSVENNNRGKVYLKKNLEKLGFQVFPSEANFLFCCVKEDSNWLCQELEKRGIIIRPMSGFGIKGNFVRITIGKPSENRFLIKKLEEILQGGKNEKVRC